MKASTIRVLTSTQASCLLLVAGLLVLHLVNCSPTPPVQRLESLPHDLANIVDSVPNTVVNVQGDLRRFLRTEFALIDPRQNGFSRHTSLPYPNFNLWGQAGSHFPFPYTYPASLHYFTDASGHSDFSHSLQQLPRHEALPGTSSWEGAPQHPSHHFPSEVRPSEQAATLPPQHPVVRPDLLLDQGFWGFSEHQTPRGQKIPVLLSAPSQGSNVPFGEAATSLANIESSFSHAAPEKDTLRASDAAASGFQYLSGRYQMVEEVDPEVNTLIASLRSRMLGLEHKTDHPPFRVQEPVPLAHYNVGDQDAIAINVFWHRAAARELTIHRQSGSRHLLLTFSSSPSFIPYKNGYGYIGVWELGASQEVSAAPLYLRGFFDFTENEYLNLDRQPETTGNVWITARRNRKNAGVMSLKIVRMTDAESGHLETDIHLRGIDRHRQPAVLFRTAMEMLGRPSSGRYVYVYRESPEIARLTQLWKDELTLSRDSFEAIRLNKDQQALLNIRMTHVFRAPKQVKMIDLENGEVLMLCYHQKLSWLPENNRNIVTFWQFGPITDSAEDAHRVLYAAGMYHLYAGGWRRLTPESVRGLRTSWFQYNNLDIP